MNPISTHSLLLNLNLSGLTFDMQVVQLVLLMTAFGSIMWFLGRIIQQNQTAKTIESLKAELEFAREDAERGIKEKDGFLSSMSHEIRTPLNGVIGLIGQLLQSDLNEEQLKYASAINFSANTLISLVNQILDLSKISSHKLELEQVDFDLKETIESITATFKANANEKGIGLRAIVHQNVPQRISGDQVRFTQILMNLVGNAIKFTDHGGVDIVVGAQKNDDGVRLQVEVNDTGAGIPEDKLNKIFKPYDQASCETARLYGGTGLGLSIAKELVALHGGSINVTSKLGKGSTFSYELQMKHAAKQVSANKPEQRELHHVPSETKILLAEDNVVNQMVVKSILDKEGYQLTIVNNGQEVIEEIYKQEFDIILMDVQMPLMGGLDATRFIRSATEPPLSEIKIIALTASVLKEDVQSCYNVGVNDFLSKPFKPNELLDKLNRNLESVAV